MQIERKIIGDIEHAKGEVLMNIVQSIEGRPAKLSDAKNIVLARYNGFHSPHMQMVIYKDVHIGNINIDMVRQHVVFTPN